MSSNSSTSRARTNIIGIMRNIGSRLSGWRFEPVGGTGTLGLFFFLLFRDCWLASLSTYGVFGFGVREFELDE